jgi:ferredoxin-NADP reductase
MTPAAPASVLALATTAHLILAALLYHRRHRARFLPTSVSALFVVCPWVAASPAAVAVGVVLHVAWLFVIARSSAEEAAADPVAGGPGPRPSSPSRSAFVETTVVAVTEEADDIRTFRLARPRDFGFVAGQFLPIRVTVAGREHVRCYSISSSPESRDRLEISVKRQGLVSTALHTLVAPGGRLAIKAPAGGFTYPRTDSRPLLLLAGGIGITPLLSMMRFGVSVEPDRPITLLYSSPSASSLAFRSEISELVRRGRRANAIFAVTRGSAGPGLYQGRIDSELIRTAVPDVGEAIAFICGPQPMIDGMRTTLSSLGVPPDRIRAEAFEAAVAIAGGRSPRRTREDDVPHEVRCAKTGRAAQVDPGQTLLDAAEAGGFGIDSLCRAGVCGTCRTRIVNGDAECESMTLGEQDRREGFVLACVTYLRTDCVIEV